MATTVIPATDSLDRQSALIVKHYGVEAAISRSARSDAHSA
jgi:hypothetical protein